MKFDIITIFPEIFDSYFNESIIGRARKNKLIEINVCDLRDWAENKHRKVDDRPYGGGPGMVMGVEPVLRAVAALKKLKITCPDRLVPTEASGSVGKNKKQKIRTILFSTKGKKFDQKIAKRFSRYDKLILICGRYEGVDERVAKYIADEEISFGDFVLTGGEVPAMAVVDAVSRFLPGVLGKEESLEDNRGGAGIPAYTRPEVVKIAGKNRRVPRVLLSGDHKKIEEWRRGRQ